MGSEEQKMALDGEFVLERLNWRYAVKKFDSERKIEETTWDILQSAMVLAPSSYGLQPYRFIVITDSETREKLRPACYGQSQIVECSHLVVIAAKTTLDDAYVESYADLIQEIRGTPRENIEDYITKMKQKMGRLTETGEAVSWSRRQAYLALGFLLETAALLEVDACPMEGFEPSKVDEILGLEGHTSSVLCALGYRAEDDWLAELEKVRFPEAELVRRID